LLDDGDDDDEFSVIGGHFIVVAALLHARCPSFCSTNIIRALKEETEFDFRTKKKEEIALSLHMHNY